MPRLPHRPTPLRAVLTVLLLGVVSLAPITFAPGAVATGGDHHPPATGAPDLGSRVVVFDDSMPVAQIRARADEIWQQQVDAEMSTERWSLLFEPGTYGTDTEPLQIKVGYYTEVAGLGASPSDTVINGKVEVYNRCLTDGPTQPYCVALNNFWRSLSNLTIDVNGTGQDGCRATANFWATSQAASLRRVDIRGGDLSLMDYCTDGPQFASGGYLADSRAGTVVNGSQQQWLTRNSQVGSWSNGVWNQVFSGTVGAPSEASFPTETYTTLDRTPVSREKPFLYVDAAGTWRVRVPARPHGLRRPGLDRRRCRRPRPARCRRSTSPRRRSPRATSPAPSTAASTCSSPPVSTTSTGAWSSGAATPSSSAWARPRSPRPGARPRWSWTAGRAASWSPA